VLVVQFPHDFIPSPYRMFWHEHLASYQLTIANSYFTSFWTRLRCETECPVVYPPVPVQVATTVSDKMVLAAASFNERHDHLKLFESFAKLQQQAPGWKMTLMARLNRGQASRRQFEKVITAAPASGVSIVANPTREVEDELFRRARLFWQASGSCTGFYLIFATLH